ncbi:MAG: NUDIX hydrolase [Bacteroidales bacterium]|nr:NUDIX hydrolase [Bacteroidales bacterium]MDD4235182.1 NUDIX hydrolase [Bacteroidales bacterium]
MSYNYKYPRPMLTVDALIFNKNRNDLFILLIKRNNPPFKNMWALPGGFVDMDEDLINAVERECFEETGLRLKGFRQLEAYGKPERDPRGRNIAIAHYIVLNEKLEPIAGDDAKDARWFLVNDLPELAFDHYEIIADGIKKVQTSCT